MENQRRKTLFLIVGLILALATPLQAAFIDYTVILNTTALSGTSGFLDLQFNPGPTPGTPSAQANVTLFSSDAVLKNIGPANGTGSVTGALPGPLVFQNTTQFNDFFQPVGFGQVVSFHVNFSGAFLTALAGNNSAFSVSLYDAVGVNPLLTTDPSGAIAIFDLAPGGVITPTMLNPAVANLSVVPLPTAAVLFPTGLILLTIAFRKLRTKGSVAV